MRAVQITRTGGPEVLQAIEAPEPVAAEGETLVRVRAAGINYVDVLIREGRYPQAPELPAVPGLEVAGETADGRRVLGQTRGLTGGYAEAVPIPDEWLLPMPEGASFEEAAAFVLTYTTAYVPLTRMARVGPGSTVLVHAATGGVGTAAIQLARHLGAHVVATAGSPERQAKALELGAHEAYGYDDFAASVRADVVLDNVGGDVFAASLRTLKPLGTLVAIGYAGGPWPPVDPAVVVGRNATVAGVYIGRLRTHAPELLHACQSELLDLWAAGAIRPVVGATFPLEEAQDAHRLIAGRRHVGKVVLVP